MNIKNIIIGIAIFILTISVGIYGILSIYGKAPQYEKYCPQINNQTECEDLGGKWIVYPEDAASPKPIPRESGYCDIYSVCNPRLEEAQEKYNRNVFLIALPLGIILIIIGALIGLVNVGGGLMAGGIGIIIYGVIGFWRFADDFIKFIISLVSLLIVIGLAYYINRKWVRKK